jgi:glycosyltransferase involved in cell wall biosynthesis
LYITWNYLVQNMNAASQPLVSIVTPVYNGEQYLVECIESVLKQTYENWEYLIVNNCSTDSTLGIAKGYAERDDRIRVYDYSMFVDVIESYNRALRLVSQRSKYCKVISADDWLFPECVARMVDLAEVNPSVGIVGAYTLRGDGTNWRVRFDGLPYRSTVVPGREACRWHLLGGHYFLGNPTSVLYRADLVMRTKCFYPNSREHADVSVFYDCFRTTDLGFIHQVLTYERVHENALGTEAKRLSTYKGSHLLDIRRYGPIYLTEEELKNRLIEVLNDYYTLLAMAVVNIRGVKFWNYHKAILEEFGAPLYGKRLAKALCMKLADLMFNPKQTFEKILRRRRDRVRKGPGSDA